MFLICIIIFIEFPCISSYFYWISRFGYVEFSNVADATKAFKKFNNKELDGRKLGA